MRREFKSSVTRLGSLLTPDRLVLTDSAVTYKKRNSIRTSFLMGFDEVSIPISKISAVEVDRHLLGATIRIISTGTKEIEANNFTWDDALTIQRLINSMI